MANHRNVALACLLASTTFSAAAASPAAQACFAPDTPEKLVREVAGRLAGSELSLAARPAGFEFADADRWSATATSGGGLVQGEPTVLTWSYVPDGTALCGYAGEPATASNLRAWLNGIYGGFATWHALFQQVFDRWSALTGITYVYEPSDDGSPFTCATILPGQLGVRGDVRIAAHRIDGNSGILAYNFFPDFGDMILDSADSFFNTTSSSSLRLRNVLAHEAGHGIGLSHVCPIGQDKLMEPFASTAFDGPQPDDVLAANRGYGDDLEDDDASASAFALGAVSGGTSLALDGRSIDDNADVDFLSFQATAPVRLTVAVSPTGSTYLSGPQNDDGSCSPGTSFNSLALHDLVLELRAANGTTVLASSASGARGEPESIGNFLLDSAGTYFLRVAGDAANTAQLYDLTLDAVASSLPALALAQSIAPGGGPHPVGSDLTFTLTASNTGSAQASAVAVRACLDPALDPLRITIFDGGALDVPPAPAGCAGDWIAWSLAPLGPSASASVSYRATIPLGTADGAGIASQAEVDSAETAAQAASPVSVTVCAPAVGSAMAADRASYLEGDAVTWTLDVVNTHGACRVNAVQVEDAIDLALVEDVPLLVWSTPAGWTSAWSGGRLSWTAGALVPGESARIVISSRVRAGVGPALLCNQASASWAESASGAASNASCSSIQGPCPPGGVARIESLRAAAVSGTSDVSLSWAAQAGASEYDLWRVTGDKAALPLAGRGASAPVAAVPGCAFPSPAAGTSCVDLAVDAAAGPVFYQLRGVCGGSEGAI